MMLKNFAHQIIKNHVFQKKMIFSKVSASNLVSPETKKKPINQKNKKQNLVLPVLGTNTSGLVADKNEIIRLVVSIKIPCVTL